MTLLYQAGCVAIGRRGVLIEGAPGSGKSSLALALIDRGATLVGDDGVTLTELAGQLLASPPPNIAGLLEVRNLGLLRYPTISAVPVALVVRLDREAPRFIETADRLTVGGIDLPLVRLWPETAMLALRSEAALHRYGLV